MFRHIVLHSSCLLSDQAAESMKHLCQQITLLQGTQTRLTSLFHMLEILYG